MRNSKSDCTHAVLEKIVCNFVIHMCRVPQNQNSFGKNNYNNVNKWKAWGLLSLTLRRGRCYVCCLCMILQILLRRGINIDVRPTVRNWIVRYWLKDVVCLLCIIIIIFKNCKYNSSGKINNDKSWKKYYFRETLL